MKAQSAIEYLTTYGWMLIAVSVTTGALYPLLSPSCSESSTGFSASNLQLEDFGVSSQENLMLLLENRRPNNVQINVVNITQDGRTRTITPNNEFIGPGGESTVELEGFNQFQQCNTLEVKIRHSIGSLDNQIVTGTIRSNINMVEVSAPSPVQNFNVNELP